LRAGNAVFVGRYFSKGCACVDCRRGRLKTEVISSTVDEFRVGGEIVAASNRATSQIGSSVAISDVVLAFVC